MNGNASGVPWTLNPRSFGLKQAYQTFKRGKDIDALGTHKGCFGNAGIEVSENIDV